MIADSRVELVVGLSGSRHGMNELQRLNLHQLLIKHRPCELHHGCCRGVDAEGHQLVRQFLPECRLVGHPPEVRALRADLDCDTFWDERSYLDRNRDVVDISSLMFVVPWTMTERDEPHSGTWATARYAQRRGVPTYLLLPDGRVEVIT